MVDNISACGYAHGKMKSNANTKAEVAPASSGQRWIIDTTTGINMQPVYLIESESGESIARVNTKSHAAFIVRACNAHEELLSALEMIADEGIKVSPIRYREIARAALQKAGGK